MESLLCFVLPPELLTKDAESLSSSRLHISIIKPKDCVCACDSSRKIEAELTVFKLQFLRLSAKNIHDQAAGGEQTTCARAHEIKNSAGKRTAAAPPSERNIGCSRANFLGACDKAAAYLSTPSSLYAHMARLAPSPEVLRLGEPGL